MVNDAGRTSPPPSSRADGQATRASMTTPGEDSRALVTRRSDCPDVLAVTDAQVAAMREVLHRLDPSLPVPDRPADDHTGPGLSEAQCIDLPRGVAGLSAGAGGCHDA